MRKTYRPYLILIFALVLFGSQHPATKIISADIEPFLFNFIRFFFAGLALAPFAMKGPSVSKKDLLQISILGFFGIFLMSVISYIGLKLSTATNAVIFINVWPLFVAVLAPFLIKEKVKLKTVAGLIVGFLGVIIVLSNGMNFAELVHQDYFLGNMLILFAALCLAIFTMYNKKFVLKYGGLKVVFYSVCSGTVLLFLGSIVTGEISGLSQISIENWLITLWIAIPTTAIGWVIWFRSIDVIGLVKSSSFFLAIPVFGVIFSYLMLGEELSIYTFVGGLLILTGIYIVQRKT
jgi:drug/metabolite transporter (DMT)-like permease